MKSFKLIVSFGLILAACETPSIQKEERCEYCPQMIPIGADAYEMGEWKDRGYGRVEGPRHTVTFNDTFFVAAYEVTLGEFARFVREAGHVSKGLCNIYTEERSWHIEPSRSWQTPGFKQEPDHPVVCISWEDTQAYIAWLNDRTGNTYRLISEAEWEYLAVHGDLTENGVVTHNVANMGREECCGGKVSGSDRWMYTSPVGSFPADKFGTFDVRGNVWEWQADCYEPTYEAAPEDGDARVNCQTEGEHVIRGGGYADNEEYMHPQFRLPGNTQQGYFTVGFRLAQDAE